MSLTVIMAEDRRLVILRSLSEANGFALNESTLKLVLSHFGHAVAADVLRADLEWLGQHGLIRKEIMYPASGELWLAHLLTAGADVASGAAHHPGVRRRGPGE